MINFYNEQMSVVHMILYRRSSEGVYDVRLADFLNDAFCGCFRIYIYMRM